jgi:hypothetical protein
MVKAGKGPSTSSSIDKHGFAELEFAIGTYVDIGSQQSYPPLGVIVVLLLVEGVPLRKERTRPSFIGDSTMRFKVGCYYIGDGPEIYKRTIFLVLEVGESGWIKSKSWDADFISKTAHYSYGHEEWLNTNLFTKIQEIEDVKRQFPGFPE